MSPRPTNAWFENLLLETGRQPVETLPYYLKTQADGLDVCVPVLDSTSFSTAVIAPFVRNWSMRVAGNTTMTPKVTGFTDLGCTVQWSAGMTADLVRGMAYVTVRYTSVTPQVNTLHAITSINGTGTDASTTSSFTGTKFKIVLNNGQTWILYASSSVTLAMSGGNTLTGSGILTGTLRLAYLPSGGTEAALDAAATRIPSGGTVGMVTEGATYTKTLTFTASGTGTLLTYAMLHHQDTLVSPVYPGLTVGSLMGSMRAVSGDTWTVRMTMPAVSWTNVGTIGADRLAAVQTALAGDQSFVPVVNDPYFGGKQLQKAGRLALIADQLGNTAARDQLVGNLRTVLTSYLTGGNIASRLRYDTVWGGVVSEKGLADPNVDFGNGRYNDHYFHYGYTIYAAAVVARFDATWLAANRARINDLVRDIANPAPVGTDPYFTPFRHFDHYRGHSWAAGLFEFDANRNQESTSEAVNAWNAVQLWGEATNQPLVTNLGRALMAEEIRTARRYWQVKQADTLYPQPFRSNGAVGIVWGGKVDYGTWFGAEVEKIHGIQMIPITPASESLIDTAWISETWPNKLSPAYAGMVEGWKSIVLGAYALINPSDAWTRAQALTAYDDGTSKTQLLYHIATQGTPANPTDPPPGTGNGTYTATYGATYGSAAAPASFVVGTTRPEAGNTGYDAALIDATLTGNQTYSTSQTVANKIIAGNVVVASPASVTFENCWIQGQATFGTPGYNGTVEVQAGATVTLNNCTIAPRAGGYYLTAINCGGKTTAYRCDISQAVDLVRMYSTTGGHSFRGCYFHDVVVWDGGNGAATANGPIGTAGNGTLNFNDTRFPGWSQNDCINVSGGAGNLIEGCTFDEGFTTAIGTPNTIINNPSGFASARKYPDRDYCGGIQLEPFHGVVTGLQIVNNWFTGGEYGIRSKTGGRGFDTGNTATISGNRFDVNQKAGTVGNPVDPHTQMTLTTSLGTHTVSSNVYSSDITVPVAMRGTPLQNPTTVAGVANYEVTTSTDPGTGTPTTTVPTVPLSVTATATASTATISWQPPTSNGGAAITGYRVSRNGSATSGTGAYSTVVAATVRSFQMNLLFSGTSYTLTVAAINAVGDGPSVSRTVTTTAATTDPGTGTPSTGNPSGQAMPVGDLAGWKQIFTDDFTTNVALGSWPGPYANKWRGYPEPWLDTSDHGMYSPGRTHSVSNSILDIWLHSEGTQRYVGAPEPKINYLTSTTQRGQLYGRYAIRMRADSMHLYKAAYLLWPDTNDSNEGEIDFPEGDFDDVISGYSHDVFTGNHANNAFTVKTTQRWQTWHTFVIEWKPNFLRYILDGTILGTTTSTTAVPRTKMHWVIQNETALGSASPSLATQGHVQIDWVAVWAYAP